MCQLDVHLHDIEICRHTDIKRVTLLLGDPIRIDHDELLDELGQCLTVEVLHRSVMTACAILQLCQAYWQCQTSCTLIYDQHAQSPDIVIDAPGSYEPCSCLA